MNEMFRQFAQRSAQLVGSSWAFILSVVIILAWAVTGPMFHYSDTWQLVINTGTTIITFLMVFLIQNTQNRDAKAIHLKLDELIKGVKGARTGLVNLESLSDEELERRQQEFKRLHKSTVRVAPKTKEQEAKLEQVSESLHEAADELQEAKAKT